MIKNNSIITLKKFLKQKSAVLGSVFILILIITAVFAPLIAPHDPTFVDISQKLQSPSWNYLLGTDNLGRCTFSRLIWGARYSLFYTVIVLGISMCLGIVVGITAGYVGGKVDSFLMRIVEMGLSMPGFMIALAIAGTLGPSGKNLVLAMSLVWWTPYARLIRGMTIQIREQEFILASKGAGSSTRKILTHHIAPNILGSILVLATLEVGNIILSIAGFSFLGLGVQPPTPEWGIMLSDSKAFIQTQPQLMVYPGLVIIFAVMAFNLTGEGIKNALRKGKQSIDN